MMNAILLVRSSRENIADKRFGYDLSGTSYSDFDLLLNAAKKQSTSLSGNWTALH